jgi:hypothetical protein
MAGYSGTPLVKKLGIKPGHHLALLGAPAGFTATLGDLPDGVAVQNELVGDPLDVIVLFAPDEAALRRGFATAARRLCPAGGLWVAWPKKASGVPTDLTETEVRAIGLAAGLVDNKVCAVDDVWAGLRFVIRVQDRPKRK